MENLNEPQKRNSILLKVILAVIAVLWIICMLFNFNVLPWKLNFNIVNNKTETTTKTENIKLESTAISHDEKYGGIYVNITIDEFNKLGFQFGDSINAEFSNGYKMEDIPYYNGYYVGAGKPLLVGYPGYDYIRIGINYGDDLWNVANVSTDTTCSITLNEAKKYLSYQQAGDIHYEDVQGDKTDEVFANFRPMNIGNLNENMVYRGASPIDNKHNRAPVSDRLIKNANIQYDINLADNEDEINQFSSKEDFNSPYFMSLYNNKKVSLLSMNIQYKTEEFSKKLIQGLTDMANNEGPYYIHCQEGKDRTGYFCMVVGAIGGATYDELIADYMKTYENYYGITIESSKEKYERIKESNIDDMLLFMANTENLENLKNANMEEIATNYLIRIGMEKEQIDLLKSKIVTKE